MKFTLQYPVEIEIDDAKLKQLFENWLKRWEPDSREAPETFKEISASDLLWEAVEADAVITFDQPDLSDLTHDGWSHDDEAWTLEELKEIAVATRKKAKPKKARTAKAKKPADGSPGPKSLSKLFKF